MKRKKRLSRSYKTLLVLGGLVFLFLIGITITIQTQWGQKKIISYVIDQARKEGIELSIEKIEGAPPFVYELKNIDIILSKEDHYHIDALQFQISLLPLIKKEIAFSYFYADGISIVSSKEPESSQSIPPWFEPPLAFTFRSFELNHLHWKVNTRKMVDLQIKGKAKFRKKGRRLSVNVTLQKQDDKDNILHLKATAIKQTHSVISDITCKISDPQKIAEFIRIDYPLQTEFTLHAAGSWTTYWKILKGPSTDYEKLHYLSIIGDGYVSSSLYSFLGKIVFSFKAKYFENFAIAVPTFKAHNEYLEAKGKMNFDPHFDLSILSANLYMHDLSKLPIDFPVSGSFISSISAKKDNTSLLYNLDFAFHDLLINRQPILAFTGKSSFYYENEKIDGDLDFQTKAIDQIFNGQVAYSWTNHQSLMLSDLSIEGFTSSIKGNLQIQPDQIVLGTLNMHSDFLKELRIFFPHIDIFGKMDAQIQFDKKIQDETPMQTTDIAIHMENFHLYELFSNDADIHLQLENVLHNPKGMLFITMRDAKYLHMHLDHFAFETANTAENWPYEIKMHGTWKDPFDFSSYGYWRWTKEELFANIQELSGHMLNHPFSATKPIQLEKTSTAFSLKDMQIIMPTSSLNANISLNEKNADIRIVMDHFPLDFLSFNPLELTFSGYTSLEAVLSAKDNDVSSQMNILLDKMQIFALGDEKPLQVNGKFTASLQNQVFQAEGEMKLREHQLMQLNARLPIKLKLYPFNAQIDPYLPLNTELTYNGQMEEILDFFHTGIHRVEGDLHCKLQISESLSHPHIDGFATIENGLYENYFTGTHFENMQASFTANKQALTLTSFSAKDTQDGTITASGNIDINYKNHFPFSFHAQLNNILCVQSELATATANGEVLIQGNSKEALAKGEIYVPHIEMNIPKKLPTTIPNLPVIYQNVLPNSKDVTFPQKEKVFPMNLDFTINTSDDVFIKGRGLNSQWTGNFIIKGTYTDILPKGELNMIKGDYDFYGKHFTLSEGHVIFTGQTQMPDLNVIAEITQKGTTIQAHLTGPLNSPDLTFTSSPPLSLSAIMSLLIFGQDITEITGFQAAQLAALAAALSTGGGGGGMEGGQYLGIDRLAVVTSKKEGEGEQYALQVGKYVARGVLVSVSQGAEQGSSNVIVEVDLTHGFTFQAETQQEEEQGKFSIKWNVNF